MVLCWIFHGKRYSIRNNNLRKKLWNPISVEKHFFVYVTLRNIPSFIKIQQKTWKSCLTWVVLYCICHFTRYSILNNNSRKKLWRSILVQCNFFCIRHCKEYSMIHKDWKQNLKILVYLRDSIVYVTLSYVTSFIKIQEKSFNWRKNIETLSQWCTTIFEKSPYRVVHQ